MKKTTTFCFAVCTLLIVASFMGTVKGAQADYLGVANGNSFSWTMTLKGNTIGTNSCTVSLTVVSTSETITNHTTIITCNTTSTNDTMWNATYYNNLGGLKTTIVTLANASIGDFFIAKNAENKTYNSGPFPFFGATFWINDTYDDNGVLSTENIWASDGTDWSIESFTRASSIPGYSPIYIIALLGLTASVLSWKKIRAIKAN
jgi:hypothetical protein